MNLIYTCCYKINKTFVAFRVQNNYTFLQKTFYYVGILIFHYVLRLLLLNSLA